MIRTREQLNSAMLRVHRLSGSVGWRRCRRAERTHIEKRQALAAFRLRQKGLKFKDIGKALGVSAAIAWNLVQTVTEERPFRVRANRDEVHHFDEMTTDAAWASYDSVRFTADRRLARDLFFDDVRGDYEYADWVWRDDAGDND